MTCFLIVQWQWQRTLGVLTRGEAGAVLPCCPWDPLKSLHLKKYWCCYSSIFSSSPPSLPLTCFLPLPHLSCGHPLCSLLHLFPFCALTATVSAVQKAEDSGTGWWLSILGSGVIRLATVPGIFLLPSGCWAWHVPFLWQFSLFSGFLKIAAFYLMSQGVPAHPCFVKCEQSVPIGEFRGTKKASSAAVQPKYAFVL